MRKFIITVICFILSAVILFTLFKDFKAEFSEPDLAFDENVIEFDDYAESLKDIPSDIEGLSQYDKYKMGLEFQNGSDSDYDGLTDKEEIEVYGTDPLKASTSGDLYTDGYKVLNNMDLTTKYPYADDRSFEHNACDEVELTALNADDFNAVVSEYGNRYTLESWGIKNVYKGYFIYSFSGNLSINVADITEESKGKYDVWISEGPFLINGFSSIEECDYVLENNEIKINKELDASEYYYIFITEDTNVFKMKFNCLITPVKETETQKKNNNFCLGVVKLFTSGTVYYNKEQERSTDEIINSLANAIGEGSESVKYIGLTERQLKLKYLMYKKVLPFAEVDLFQSYRGLSGVIEAFYRAFFSYGYFDGDNLNEITFDADIDDIDEEGENKRLIYKKHHTTFDVNVDELPFDNFGCVEYGGQGGNCSGFTYLTAYLFNQKTFPSSGNYDSVSWNLSNDKDNKTLMNPGLFDYKNKDFLKGKIGIVGNGAGIKLDKLTKGEREFVKMICSGWKQSNDIIPGYAIDTKQGVPWSVAESIIDRLNQNKVVNVGLLMANGCGHEITVFDYYYISEDEVIFRVYDCNIPHSKLAKVSNLTIENDLLLQCKKVLKPDGTYNMIYVYCPYKGNTKYFATSHSGLVAKCGIVVTDETFTIYGSSYRPPQIAN